MDTPTTPQVEPYFPGGPPGEDPIISSSHIAGQDDAHVPLRVACLAMAIYQSRRFWDGMRERQG
jgi:hypothetical protein